MPKRPRLSANMRTPERVLAVADATETPTHTDATASQPATDDRLAAPPQPVIERWDQASTPRKPESLFGITGDALMTLSLASSIGLTQGMALQLRLSSYILGLDRSPFRPS